MSYKLMQFQSTLPQGERHDTFYEIISSPTISIHAPTRGATRTMYPYTRSRRFQSTLPQGERRFYDTARLLYEYFNPRSNKGSDSMLAA